MISFLCCLEMAHRERMLSFIVPLNCLKSNDLMMKETMQLLLVLIHDKYNRALIDKSNDFNYSLMSSSFFVQILLSIQIDAVTA